MCVCEVGGTGTSETWCSHGVQFTSHVALVRKSGMINLPKIPDAPPDTSSQKKRSWDRSWFMGEDLTHKNTHTHTHSVVVAEGELGSD